MFLNYDGYTIHTYVHICNFMLTNFILGYTECIKVNLYFRKQYSTLNLFYATRDLSHAKKSQLKANSEILRLIYLLEKNLP